LPSVEVIYLSRRDTINTARELLYSATPGAQVWLVVPWGMRAMRNLVNMKLVQRAADTSALDLRLVTSHLQTRSLAREAHIPVYYAVPGKLRRYKRTRRDDALGLPARVVPVEERLGAWYEHRPRQLGLGTAFLSLIVILILVGVLAGLAVAFVPSATVRLQPVSQPVAATFEVTAHSGYREVDLGPKIIPARVVQVIVNGRGETPASGRKDLPDGHATGEAVFANKSTQPVKIPKGTIVRTGSGVNVRFVTVGDVELPATMFATVRVGVSAMDAGPSGNVQALTINAVEGALANSVTVLNDKPTQGGTMKRVATVASGDFDLLKADMIKRLEQETLSQLVSALGQGEFIPPNSLQSEAMPPRFDQVVDQQSDVLSGEMKVVIKGMAVDGQALQTLAAHVLQQQIGDSQALIEDSLAVQRSEEMRIENNTVRFSVTARGVAGPVINMDRVKTALRGQTVPQATAWLKRNLPLQDNPEVSVLPAQWDYLPLLSTRINVVVSAGAK
jgi:hypothetical protein